MRKIGEVLGESLRKLRLTERVHAHRALVVWDEAVGERVAAHARAVQVSGTVLRVNVDHNVWLAQLGLMKPIIVARLNEHLGAGTLTDIELRIGGVAPPAAPRAPKPPPRPDHTPLSRADAAEVERDIAGVTDPDLRALLSRLRAGAEKPAPRTLTPDRRDPSDETRGR